MVGYKYMFKNNLNWDIYPKAMAAYMGAQIPRNWSPVRINLVR